MENLTPFIEEMISILSWYKPAFLVLFFTLFSVYAMYWSIVYPSLPSWSKSYYELEYRPIFQFWVLSLSLLVILIGLNLFWLIVGFVLSFVAFFPTIKNEKHFKWHMVSATTSLGSAYVYILCVTEIKLGWCIYTSLAATIIGAKLIVNLDGFKETYIKLIESVVFCTVFLYFVLE